MSDSKSKWFEDNEAFIEKELKKDAEDWKKSLTVKDKQCYCPETTDCTMCAGEVKDKLVTFVVHLCDDTTDDVHERLSGKSEDYVRGYVDGLKIRGDISNVVVTNV